MRNGLMYYLNRLGALPVVHVQQAAAETRFHVVLGIAGDRLLRAREQTFRIAGQQTARTLITIDELLPTQCWNLHHAEEKTGPGAIRCPFQNEPERRVNCIVEADSDR